MARSILYTSSLTPGDEQKEIEPVKKNACTTVMNVANMLPDRHLRSDIKEVSHRNPYRTHYTRIHRLRTWH